MGRLAPVLIKCRGRFATNHVRGAAGRASHRSDMVEAPYDAGILALLAVEEGVGPSNLSKQQAQFKSTSGSS